jgi:serine/threonine-protein kinase RsbW
MPDDERSLELVASHEYESTLDSVDLAEGKAVEIAQTVGLPEEDTFRLGYAVREAMVNAVVHGNRYNANKKVSFQMGRTATAIEVRIRDFGDGFLADGLADPLAEENLLNQSGRGMTLIRAFVDEFRVGPAEGGGTLAVLKKSLPPGTPGGKSGSQ